MQGIQKSLYEQLERQRDRAQVEERETGNELGMLKKRKEEVGVELYGNQQQLARMQMALENLHNQYHGIGEARSAEEGVLSECKQRHAALKGGYTEKQKTLLKAQAELDTLTSTMRQVETYNDEMKSEIAITRRATYKAESSVAELEKAKQGQDLYIDQLNENVKSLQEEVMLYESQFGAQKSQTDEAKDILKETSGEMDLIVFEKKQLMVQWKASLINLTKRDEAVAAATKQVDQAKAEIQDMQSDLIGTRREIAAAQVVNEAGEALRDRLAKEMGSLEEQVGKILAERDVLAERYQMLQRSLAQTAEEEKNAGSIKEELKKKVDAVLQNILVVGRERQALEVATLSKANEKLTVAKAVKNYGKSMEDLKSRIHDREAESATVDNERSRVRVDQLNTDAHNAQLRELVNKAVGELSDKDKLIEKYQLEIRQRNDEIEKKMLKVDTLNRKYEKLLEAHRAAGGGEGPLLGPLEATIKSLKKDIADLQDESVGLQREWLADQTGLVDTSGESELLLERNAELRARASILTEKRMRTTKQIALVEAEIKGLDSSALSMQTDMARLNELIGVNGRQQEELLQQNSVTEMEFVAQLKELESKSVEAETRLRGTVEKKDELLDEIMEAERQLLLWEKKIQLEKETQAALDPSVGQGEVHAMEKEIHRMTLRAATLKGEKERLVKEIERGVHKRESLSLRFKGQEMGKKKQSGEGASKGLGAASTKKGAGSGGGDITRADLGKKLAGLKKAVRTTAQSSAEYDMALNERKTDVGLMTQQLEEHTAKYGSLEEAAAELQATINRQLYEKQRMAEVASKRHRSLKRYQALEQGQRQPVTESDQALIDARLSEAERGVLGVRKVISVLGDTFDHLGEVLGRVMELAADE